MLCYHFTAVGACSTHAMFFFWLCVTCPLKYHKWITCLIATCKGSHIRRVGHNRIYAPYMTVYWVISLPKIPYI